MEALYNRGNTKLVLNDNAGAIADFDRVIALAPNFDEAYNNRGSAKSMFGDKKGAMLDYNKQAVYSSYKHQITLSKMIFYDTKPS